ncbi:MAG TPA: imidazole glycerol phosphate synthase subunit HisF [Clostridiaceae bacterium]|jgi:cyclase|nr:imidazole glycerol phosphate synthase subunit HisF [Clostridiaceae bacterium]
MKTENNLRKIIPCLDLKDGKVVKGTNFVGLREMGDPLTMAKHYCVTGADELAILDISKTQTGADFNIDLIYAISSAIDIELIVGGGIASLADVARILQAGADKVSIASAALNNPLFIEEAASKFGSEKIIVAFDIQQDSESGKHYVYTHGGTKKSDWEVFSALEKFTKLGAGEFLITGIDFDGAKQGFDLEFFKEAVKYTDKPLIASGGAGKIEDFVELFKQTSVKSGLAASIFHQNEVEISELKKSLAEAGIEVRL